jgi:hypothetical protein
MSEAQFWDPSFICLLLSRSDRVLLFRTRRSYDATNIFTERSYPAFAREGSDCLNPRPLDRVTQVSRSLRQAASIVWGEFKSFHTGLDGSKTCLGLNGYQLGSTMSLVCSVSKAENELWWDQFSPW